MSHLGLGAEFGNIIMMVLLAAAAFFLVRFLMRRFMPSNPTAAAGGMQLAGAGAPFPKPPASFPDERPAQFRGPPVGGDGSPEQASGSAPLAAPLRRSRQSAFPPTSTCPRSSASPS
jgi:hypothetical protein